MENKRILFKLSRLMCMCIVSLYLISNGCVVMSLRVCCLLYLHYFLSPDDDGDLISSVRMIWMYLSLLTTKEKFRPFLNNDTLVLSLAWKVDYKIIQQLLTGPWNYRSSSSQNIGQLNGGGGAPGSVWLCSMYEASLELGETWTSHDRHGWERGEERGIMAVNQRMEITRAGWCKAGPGYECVEEAGAGHSSGAQDKWKHHK